MAFPAPRREILWLAPAAVELAGRAAGDARDRGRDHAAADAYAGARSSGAGRAPLPWATQGSPPSTTGAGHDAAVVLDSEGRDPRAGRAAHRGRRIRAAGRRRRGADAGLRGLAWRAAPVSSTTLRSSAISDAIARLGERVALELRHGAGRRPRNAGPTGLRRRGSDATRRGPRGRARRAAREVVLEGALVAVDRLGERDGGPEVPRGRRVEDTLSRRRRARRSAPRPRARAPGTRCRRRARRRGRAALGHAADHGGRRG